MKTDLREFDMEIKSSKLGTVVEFLSPLEKDLHVVLAGDGIPKLEVTRLTKAVDYQRATWAQIPNVSDKYQAAQIVHLTSSELFHGKGSQIMDDYPTLFYMDPDLSYNTLMILCGKGSALDKVDEMLTRRYIIEQSQNKFIFNLGEVGSETTEYFTKAMDEIAISPNMGPDDPQFNYFISGKYLGVWIYFLPESLFKEP